MCFPAGGRTSFAKCCVKASKAFCSSPTAKWFYKLISEGHFPKPIKLGRSSRWYKSEVEQWMQQRIEESRGAAA
ncbi:TPA: AlpA family phage regulatory protein [Escherichia coli]|nr:AlpA family phage regulatory protein [Escherichia coli]